jgi:hypothetical protein
MRKILPVLLPVLLSVPVAAFARQAEAPLPDWDRLTPQQRELLIAPVRDRWNESTPEQRQRMLDHARRWETMTPEQRERARRGHERWRHMSPEGREQARVLFHHMRNLPEAERKALVERWKAMTPEQRKAWIEEHAPRGQRGPSTP